MPWTGINLIGQTFGDLSIVEKVGKNKYGWMWKCKCKCGNFTTVIATKLRNGSTKSCGCNLRGEKHYMWTGHKGLSGYFWRRVLGRAKIKHLDVTLTVKDAWELLETQNHKCALSGVILTTARNTRGLLEKYQTASLDRIDSSKGYTIDNVQWVHKDLNIMKMDMCENDLIFWARKITSHFKNKIINNPTSERSRWDNRNKDEKIKAKVN